MSDWRDETSYSQGRRGKDEPSVWVKGRFPHEITVHRLVGAPDTWFVTCTSARVNNHELSSADAVEARREAMGVVGEALDEVRAALMPLLRSE